MSGRKALEYYVLDVFSNESYKGNPLSVVFTDGNLKLETYPNFRQYSLPLIFCKTPILC